MNELLTFSPGDIFTSEYRQNYSTACGGDLVLVPKQCKYVLVSHIEQTIKQPLSRLNLRLFSLTDQIIY